MPVAEVLKRNKEEKARIKSRLVELLETQEASSSTPAGEGGVMVTVLAGEGLEEHKRLVTRWNQISSEEQVLEDHQDKAKLEASTDPNGTALSAKAAINKQTWATLKAVRDKKHQLKEIPQGIDATASQMILPQPMVVKDVQSGVNKVIPIAAVFDKEGEQDEQASWDHWERVRAGVEKLYDPQTGKRLEAAGSEPIVTTDVPGSVPDLVTDLYRYMIVRNEIARYCRIEQTPGINKLYITRRINVPKATIIGGATANVNAGQGQAIGDQQSTFDNIFLEAFKYAFISVYSPEAQASVTPWSVMAQVAEDGGIGLANGMGEHFVIGTGGATQPNGLSTALKALAARQVDGLAQNQMAANFDIVQFLNIVGKLDQAYIQSPSLRFVMNIATYFFMLGVRDSDGNPLFWNPRSSDALTTTLGPFPVTLDQNVEAIGENKYPIIFGDLSGHVVRYAGPPRIDSSMIPEWAKDLISYRFIHHADSELLDPNAFSIYKVAGN